MNKEVISILKDLISIDSRNPFKAFIKNNKWFVEGNETDISDYIESKLKKCGFLIEKQFVHEDINGNKFYNILAEKGNGKRSILFYAHMDTVGCGTWLSLKEALSPKIDTITINNEKIQVLKGLGSNDMKAGIAVLLSAFCNINIKDFKLKLAFGVDEEFYSLGANVLTKSDFLKDVKIIIVPEIGDGPNQCYGPSTLGIGRLGRCEFEIDVFGSGGHGADVNNKRFVNALVEASKLAIYIDDLRNKLKDEFYFLPEGYKQKNSIRGSFFLSKLIAGEGILSIPYKATLTIDWTFTPNLSVDLIKNILEKEIHKIIENKKLEIVVINNKALMPIIRLKKRPTKYSNAYFISINHPYIKGIKKVIENCIGFKNFNMGYSVADENVFKTYHPDIPVFVIGPLGDNSHKNDEWVGIQSVNDLLKVYRELVNNFNYIIKGM